MSFSPRLHEELDKNLMRIEPVDYENSILYISQEEIIKAHFEIVNFFGTNDFKQIEGKGIGGVGPRDWNLFVSSCFRQYTSYGDSAKWANIYEYAATLFFGIIKNHVFYDANKRTALLVLLYHLYKNGKCLDLTEEEIEDFAVDVANDDLEKYPGYDIASSLGDPDREIKFIAYFVKRKSKDIDKKNRFITFNQLKTILRKFGYDITLQANNYAWVVKLPPALISLGRIQTVSPFKSEMSEFFHTSVKVLRIPMPGWKRQVKLKIIKDIREACNLTVVNGVDSSAFYDDHEPIRGLITLYQAPLVNLANR